MYTSSSPSDIFGKSFLDSKFFNADYLFKSGTHILSQINYLEIWSIIKVFLLIISIFFLILIAYVVVRMLELRKKEHAHLHHEIEEYAHHHAQKENSVVGTDFKNEKWKKVLEYTLSPNENDWKLAVIEADSMLEVLVDDLGFKGESLGEKLKNADRDSFHSLSSAWEVHTIRNRIAHEGSAFILTQREAKRVVALYDQIFKEFGFI